MQEYRLEYQRWLNSDRVAPDDKAELEALRDEKEIEDRFYRDLSFGTGGLRGVLGMGRNRMNVYTVRKATQGLADYLCGTSLPRSVAIAYDSRINSNLFAREAAAVLVANGINAWVYPRLEPTPALSFAVRDLGCGAGICITASHNPAKYNGYKVYGADGCQITLEAASAIQAAIGKVDIFDGSKTMPFEKGMEDGLIHLTGENTLDRFVDAVLEQRVYDPAAEEEPLKVVYTPLNGTGRECVLRILKKIGVQEVTLVPSQAEPNGNFPTCPYPNPEMPQAMEEGLALCRSCKPDLLLGTDPDCDRVGIAVPFGEDYVLLSGNEVGVLLLDYICKVRMNTNTMPARPVVVSTIVSTDMAGPVAAKYGADLRRTLTGFKFIGEQIGMLEGQGQLQRYIFGFEESYGYLSGAHVRDKDGVNAAMLICDMARWYKARGKTLYEAMEDLYSEFGVYRNGLYSVAFEGADGMTRMQDIMMGLRTDPPAKLADMDVTEMLDYQDSMSTGLPGANVLQFQLGDIAKLMIRPSGTEPKIKMYLSARGATREEAARVESVLAAAAQALLR